MACLRGALNAVYARHREAIDELATSITEAEVRTIAVSSERPVVETTAVRQADFATVKEAFTRASRSITATVANSYLAQRLNDEAEMMDEMATVAAIGLFVSPFDQTSPAIDALNAEAVSLVTRWRGVHHAAIRLLPESRQSVYTRLDTQAGEPEVSMPDLKASDIVEGANAQGWVDRHLLANPDGLIPSG